MVTFEDKVIKLLRKQGKTIHSVCKELDINPANFYKKKQRKSCQTKTTMMAWAYYLGVTVEELVEDTDLEDYWWGGEQKRTPIEEEL